MVVHPQSIVHSLVEFVDGSMLAQLGTTDMRLPIQYAFSYPERWAAPVPFLDLARAGTLEFQPPDWDEFPCLRPGVSRPRGRSQPADRAECIQRGRRGVFPGRALAFTAIADVIAATMDAHRPAPVDTLPAVAGGRRLGAQAALELVRSGRIAER